MYKRQLTTKNLWALGHCYASFPADRSAFIVLVAAGAIAGVRPSVQRYRPESLRVRQPLRASLCSIMLSQRRVHADEEAAASGGAVRAPGAGGAPGKAAAAAKRRAGGA